MVDVARLEETVVLALVGGTRCEGEYEADERVLALSVVALDAECESGEGDESRQVARRRDRNRGGRGVVEGLKPGGVRSDERPYPVFRGSVAGAKSGHDRSA